MALVFPRDIEILEPTDSEMAAYRSLSQLSDDYIVIYSVPWLNKNPKTKRLIQGESDFLIIKKNVGFLCLEVKGGVGIECSGNEWTLILSSETEQADSRFYSQKRVTFERKLKKSPFQQAREGMYYFLSYFEEFYGRRFGSHFGYAVMFPNYSVDVKGWPDALSEITIDCRDLSSIQDKVNSVFNNLERNIYRPHKEDTNLLSDLLLKQRLFSVLTSDFVRAGNRFYKEVSEIQNYLVSFLCNIPQAAIYGAAGTGKSYLAKKKAVKLADKGNNILYVCFNAYLSAFVRSELSHLGSKVDVFNFHMLIKNAIGKDRFVEVIDNGTLDLHGLMEFFSQAKLRLKKYDCIIIDEGQDFQYEWLQVLFKYFLENDKIFYIFYDHEQSIFKNQLEKFFLENSFPQFCLPANIRNTKEIHQYFIDCTGYGKSSDFNKLVGSVPEKAVFSNVIELKADLKSLVEQLVKTNVVHPSRILLLSTRDKKNSWINDLPKIAGIPIKQIDNPNFHLDDNQIPFATVQSFKGLEADIVIFLNQDVASSAEGKCLEYVAMSRARFFLYEYKIMTP